MSRDFSSLYKSVFLIREFCLSFCVDKISKQVSIVFITVSSWFLPRDAMHKRGLCCHAVSVCLSVCLSVCHAFVDHVKTNIHIFEFFSPSGSDTILVFPYQRGADIPTGPP